MKILFVTPTWLLPANSGAKSRMLSVLNTFKSIGAEVTLLYVDLNVGLPGSVEELPVKQMIFQPFRSLNKKYRLKKIVFALFAKYGPVSLFQRVALKNSQKPYAGVKPDRYTDPQTWKTLQHIVREQKPDAIWFNYALWAIYPIEELNCLTIVDTHDVLHKRLKIAKERGVAPRGIFATEEEENAWLPKFDRVVAIQPNEAVKLKQLGAKNIFVIGHILPFKKIVKQPKKFTIGFIGSINQVNLATLAYIEDEVFGKLTDEERSSFNFWTAGAVSHASKKSDKIIHDLKNIDDFFGEIDLMLNPVLEGTGLKIKNIEALAYGIPVITTPKGAEGIENSPEALIIAQLPDEVASEILRVANNPQLKEHFSASAEAFIFAYNAKQEAEIRECLAMR